MRLRQLYIPAPMGGDASRTPLLSQNQQDLAETDPAASLDRVP